MTSTQSKVKNLEEQLKIKETAVKELDKDINVEKELNSNLKSEIEQVEKELNDNMKSKIEQAEEEVKIQAQFDNVKKLIKNFAECKKEKIKSGQSPEIQREILMIKGRGIVTKGIKRLESKSEDAQETKSSKQDNNFDFETREEELVKREREVSKEVKKLENLRFVLKIDRRELFKERRILSQTQKEYDQLKQDLLNKLKQLGIERQQFESQKQIFNFDKKISSKKELEKTALDILKSVLEESEETSELPKQYFNFLEFEETIEKDDFGFQVYLIKRESASEDSIVHSKKPIGQFHLKLDRSQSFTKYHLSPDVDDTVTPLELFETWKDLVKADRSRSINVLILSHDFKVIFRDTGIEINGSDYVANENNTGILMSLIDFFCTYSKKLNDYSDIVAQFELEKYASMNLYGSGDCRFKNYYNYSNSSNEYRKNYKTLLLAHGTI